MPLLSRRVLLRAVAAGSAAAGLFPKRSGAQAGPSAVVSMVSRQYVLQAEPTGDGRLRIAAYGPDGLVAQADNLGALLETTGGYDLSLTHLMHDGPVPALWGSAGPWETTLRMSPADLPGLFQFDLALHYRGQEDTEMQANVRFVLPHAQPSSWLVPGGFYGHGQPPAYRGHNYPRFKAAGGDAGRLESNAWAFRVDRASHPMVMTHAGPTAVAIAVEPYFGEELAGVAFGQAEDGSWLGLNLPWEESPRSYVRTPSGWGGPSSGALRRVQPEETIHTLLWLYLAPEDATAVFPLVRWLYGRLAPASPLRPWFPKETAANLAAKGIYRWHADQSEAMLWETVRFQPTAEGRRIDRRQQHVAWVSGIPSALALLRWARLNDSPALAEFAVSVIDRITREGISPGGFFWADWEETRGWGTGWNVQPGRIQARTPAEATLFLLRAAAEERALGREYPTWWAAARRNLDAVLAAQRSSDGNPGSHYDVRTGVAVDYSGAAGILWTAALVEAAQVLDEPRYLAAAQRMGEYFASHVLTNGLAGAPEDVDLTPTSEDGYNALLAYEALARVDVRNRARWLALAQHAAEWTMTFRWAWNVEFHPDSTLGRLQFATRGADLASPRNQHLHPYGLICVRELLRLWEVTGDDYYLQRARDSVLAFRQTIARFDGDFGAGKGMMSEQWYQTNWNGPKGEMLPLSHVWCQAMVLHGWWALRDFGDAVLDDRRRVATLIAPGSVATVQDTEGAWSVLFTNPLGEALNLRVRLTSLAPLAAWVNGSLVTPETIGGTTFVRLQVPANGSTLLDLALAE